MPDKYFVIVLLCSYGLLICCEGTTSICQTLRTSDSSLFDRAECLNHGSFITSDNGAMSTSADGFYTYNGKWMQFNHTNRHGKEVHRWKWQIPSTKCNLMPISRELFCGIIHQMFYNIKKLQPSSAVSNSIVPKLTFIGDSITLGHLSALHQQLELNPKKYVKGQRRYDTCSIEIDFVRTNKFVVEKEFDQKIMPFSGTEWIEKVCNSHISVLNYGSHASSISSFKDSLLKARDALLKSCGKEIKEKNIRVYFRTTAEGNPFCYTKSYEAFTTMEEWNKIVWPVLVDPKNVYDLKLGKEDFFFYNQTWYWNNFQSYNKIAFELLEPFGISIIDVVGMSRLRPTVDWTRPKKPECFHANKAKYEYNVLFMNVFASDLCVS